MGPIIPLVICIPAFIWILMQISFNTTLLLILAIPFVVGIAMKVFFNKDISIVEGLTGLAVSVVLTAGVYYGGIYAQTADTEMLNGAVTSKFKDTVSCSHSYSCNCYTSCSGSGKNRSCSQHCSTCYEHFHDYDWVVKSTAGDLKIDRVDRQGSHEPQRWTDVIIGEAVALPHSFTNYVKAAKNSLFHANPIASVKYAKSVPAYPQIYDYYRANRILTVNTKIANVAEWNKGLADVLKVKGPSKQVNAIIVFTSADKGFAEALLEVWQGGKKNDAIIVIGTKDGKTLEWVKVFGWSKNSMFNVWLRDAMVNNPVIDKDVYLSYLDQAISNYWVRQSMKDFEYLKDEIEPSQTIIWIAVLLALFSSLGLNWYFTKTDF